MKLIDVLHKVANLETSCDDARQQILLIVGCIIDDAEQESVDSKQMLEKINTELNNI